MPFAAVFDQFANSFSAMYCVLCVLCVLLDEDLQFGLELSNQRISESVVMSNKRRKD